MSKGRGRVRKILRDWSGWIVGTAAVLVICFWAVASSETFQECVEGEPLHYDEAQLYKRAAFVAITASPGLRQCVGEFLSENSEAITAVFTIILAISTIGLWVVTGRLLGAGRDALEITERAFIVMGTFNRELTTAADLTPEAILHAANVREDELALQVTRFAVQPLWQNNGSTPTRNMRINVDWALGDINRLGTYRPPERRLFVAPKSTETSEFVEMPGLGNLIQGGQAGVLGPPPLMLIWGRADYEDVFGKAHFIEWCYRVRPERHTGQKLRVSFIQWGDYNRTDEDIRRRIFTPANPDIRSLQ